MKFLLIPVPSQSLCHHLSNVKDHGITLCFCFYGTTVKAKSNTLGFFICQFCKTNLCKLIHYNSIHFVQQAQFYQREWLNNVIFLDLINYNSLAISYLSITQSKLNFIYIIMDNQSQRRQGAQGERCSLNVRQTNCENFWMKKVCSHLHIWFGFYVSSIAYEVKVSNSDVQGCSVFQNCFLNWFLSIPNIHAQKPVQKAR